MKRRGDDISCFLRKSHWSGGLDAHLEAEVFESGDRSGDDSLHVSLVEVVAAKFFVAGPRESTGDISLRGLCGPLPALLACLPAGPLSA